MILTIFLMVVYMKLLPTMAGPSSVLFCSHSHFHLIQPVLQNAESRISRYNQCIRSSKRASKIRSPFPKRRRCSKSCHRPFPVGRAPELIQFRSFPSSIMLSHSPRKMLSGSNSSHNI
ncbi:hypothetical protein B0J14DRAFT_576004 [Halenospora varia]|nr:hypothetical protein B0J14DRAFT_576004 [Halenospora varia]